MGSVGLAEWPRVVSEPIGGASWRWSMGGRPQEAGVTDCSAVCARRRSLSPAESAWAGSLPFIRAPKGLWVR